MDIVKIARTSKKRRVNKLNIEEDVFICTDPQSLDF